MPDPLRMPDAPRLPDRSRMPGRSRTLDLSREPDEPRTSDQSVVPALPAGFVFGVGSSALSVEGAAERPSIWDVFAAAGRTADGTGPGSGAGARDHLAEDVRLLADLGIGAYRFSVSWPRVLPDDSGPPDPAGLGFYDELVDRLLAAGIAPWVTLYHWDLPADVMLDGGWLARDTSSRFGDFVALVADRLGDRVSAWTTITDPFDHSFYGHGIGIDAPGLTLYGGAIAASHHLLLGHAAAVAALRAGAGGLVGVQIQHGDIAAATDHDDDVAAAATFDALYNRQFAGPILGGGYPEHLDDLPGTDLSVVSDADLAAIAAPLDFYGVSFTPPVRIAAAPGNRAIGFTMVEDGNSARATDMPEPATGWSAAPEADGSAVRTVDGSAALTATLVRLSADYRPPPLYVTAGIDHQAAANDEGAGHVAIAGRDAVDDAVAGREAAGHVAAATGDLAADADGNSRETDVGTEHLISHLTAIGDAVAQGVDVRGYFARALLDGWDFGDGHTRPNGLVAVDRNTHARTPRPVFGRYTELIGRYRGR